MSAVDFTTFKSYEPNKFIFFQVDLFVYLGSLEPIPAFLDWMLDSKARIIQNQNEGPLRVCSKMETLQFDFIDIPRISFGDRRLPLYLVPWCMSLCRPGKWLPTRFLPADRVVLTKPSVRWPPFSDWPSYRSRWYLNGLRRTETKVTACYDPRDCALVHRACFEIGVQSSDARLILLTQRSWLGQPTSCAHKYA